MPKREDVIAERIIDNPSEFLPKGAMEHIEKAQEELVKALNEIAKFSDQKYLENNQEEFTRMYKALYPAISSSTDFSKSVMESLSRKMKNYEIEKTKPIMEMEKKLISDETLNEKEILQVRGEMLNKIKGMIAGEKNVGIPGGEVAVWPAAVAAGAAAVAAAVEVVTLVRSVTSSSYVDRLIRTERLNPKLVELKHSQVINGMNKLNVLKNNKVIR